MSPVPNLSKSDRERIQEILSRLSRRLNRSLTLIDLMDEWRRFVISINEGYGWSIETYYQDLEVRDLIEEISESLSSNGRKVLSVAIRDTDEHFVLATWDPEKPTASGSPQHEIGWWQFRVPKIPAEKLLSDMVELGYVFNQQTDINVDSNEKVH